MTRRELNNLYFEWMYQLVDDGRYSEVRSYLKLLQLLHETEFIFSVPMDANRAEDGTDLRYRFAYECGHDDRMVALYLDDKTCSVLEMMIALALKCEEHISYDPDLGNRTGIWFWDMLQSMGLDTMDDSEFDEKYVNDIIIKFLNRKYCKNGKGGLFTIKNCKYDLRKTEIWYQMCWYMDTIL